MLTERGDLNRGPLSRLVDEALKGEPFVIARAGKPLVKVTMLDAPESRRTGFLKDTFDVPDDFDTMAADECALRGHPVMRSDLIRSPDSGASWAILRRVGSRAPDVDRVAL